MDCLRINPIEDQQALLHLLQRWHLDPKCETWELIGIAHTDGKTALLTGKKLEVGWSITDSQAAFYFNPLNTKRRLLYLKTQFVPRSKHFQSRL